MKTIIAAIDRRGAIGFGGDLPWGRSLRDDLANFQRTTRGSSLIMGRKTFESIGSRPLSDRENIVVSSKPTGVKGVLTAVSPKSAYALARYPIFVIGGGQIYTQTILEMDRLIITHIDAEFPGADVFFPPIDPDVWQEVSREHYHEGERNAYQFDIVIYEKKT